jgi:hypothetical protein
MSMTNVTLIPGKTKTGTLPLPVDAYQHVNKFTEG